MAFLFLKLLLQILNTVLETEDFLTVSGSCCETNPVANSSCHRYNRDERQQAGFSPAVSTLLQSKWDKRPLGKEAAESLFWPQSFFPLPGPKLTPPNSGVCPMPMEKAAVPDRGGPASTSRLRCCSRCQMLDGNYRQTRPANRWHQSSVRPALCNSHHVTVFTVKVNYILTCRLKFPHVFSIAQVTSSDKTEPNF